MKYSLFHLVYHGFENTVIESQVVTPALILQKEDISIHLIFLEDFSTWFRSIFPGGHQPYKNRLQGLTFSLLPRFPRNFLFLNTGLIFLKILPSLLVQKNVLLHARGLQGAAAVVLLKKVFRKIKVICDIRGIESEEYAYSIVRAAGRLNNFQKIWKGCLESLSRRALLRSDVKFGVSKSMLRYFQEWVGTSDHNKWEYIPCAVEAEGFSSHLSERQENRKKLGIEKKLVVVYAGAYGGWQMPEQTVRWFQSLKQIEPRSFFLCLTPNLKQFSDLLKRENINSQDFLVREVSHREIADFMVCGDIGILLREENPLNAYSCPTKFAEYLACGLSVVTTAAIKDVAAIVSKESVGVVINDVKDENGIQSALKKVLENLSEEQGRMKRSVDCAKNYFDWNRYTPVIKKWYLELLSNP